MVPAATRVYGAAPGAIGATMPDEPATTARGETWADWWPDEPTDPEGLLTTQELVDRAHAEGVKIGASELANWQRAGVVPRGIPHRVGRVLRRLYPERYLALLRDVRALQAEGWRLAAIGPMLRRPRGSATVTFAGRARSHVRRGDPILTADAALAETLRAIARDHEAAYGGRIVEARLTLVDAHGNPLTLAVETDEPVEAD